MWRLTFTVHLWSKQVSSPFPHKYQPSSGLSSSLLMKTSCLRLRLATDQSTTSKGVKINLHSSSLIKNKCQVHFPYKYQPSSGLSSSLLMKTSCLRLKLVELNFFASFNAEDQRKTYVSNISKYTFKSSRWTFSIAWCLLQTFIWFENLTEYKWFNWSSVWCPAVSKVLNKINQLQHYKPQVNFN